MGNLITALKQSSIYFGANVLVQICGLISFPIWTRLLSQAEYGLFSLIVVTISLLTSCSKFGLQHAALRFYPRYEEHGDSEANSSYYTTILLSSIFITVLVCSGFYAFSIVVGNSSNKPTINAVGALVAILVVVNSIVSIYSTIIRAAQKAYLLAVISVIKKYGNFIMAIVFISLFSEVQSIFFGWLVVDILVLLWLAQVVSKEFDFRLAHFSWDMLKKAIGYGLPLMAFEISSTLLSVGDRYLLNYYLGEASVGVYSAGYNLASYCTVLLSAPLRMAIIPKFLSIWKQKGEKETKEFLNRIADFYLMAGIPMVCGMFILRDHLMITLASEKFAESATIIPYVVLPMIIYGGFFIYGAGFFIFKRSLFLGIIAFIAAVVNIILNILLIPALGIKGAAIATLGAYLLLSYLIYSFSGTTLKIKFTYVSIGKYFLSSLIMMTLLYIVPGNSVYILVGKILLGIVSYIFCMLLLDPKLRELFVSIIKKKKIYL